MQSRSEGEDEHEDDEGSYLSWYDGLESQAMILL